jgi:hypothetical protein
VLERLGVRSRLHIVHMIERALLLRREAFGNLLYQQIEQGIVVEIGAFERFFHHGFVIQRAGHRLDAFPNGGR